MNIYEAYDAFSKTLDDIASAAISAGLGATVEVSVCDSELQPIGEEIYDTAALIAGKITLSSEQDERTVEFEGAIPVQDGTVISDEMISEVTEIRASVKDFLARLEGAASAAEAFTAVCDEETEEAEEPQIRTFNNKPLYVGAAVLFIALAVILLLIGKL